jgi:hypothetical protein
MNSQSKNRPLTDKALVLKIRKKVLTMEKVLKNSIGAQLLNQKNDDKQKKKNKKISDDKDKKKRKQSLLEKVRNKAAVKTGIFDGLTNFFVNSLLGFVFTKIIPFLPRLTGILGALKPAGDFLALIARLFMGAIGGFIETGYKVHDQLKGKHDTIKKIPIKQEFNSFQQALTNTLSDVTDVVYKIAGQDTPKTTTSKTQQKPIKGAATGGTIGPTRGNIPVYKSPTRELKSTRQTRVPRKQSIPETNIGKDVGGEAKVREFYRSPKIGLGGILGIFRPKGTPSRKTPVDSISNISKSLRRRNQLFGDIASVGSDLALGQKPSKTVYKNTAKDVIELARFIAERQEQKQKDSIFAMAYGGVIPSRASEVASRNNLVEMVSVIIERSVEERVNKAIGDFRQPIGRDEMLEKNRQKGGGASGPGGTSSGGYNDSGISYGGMGNVESIKITNFNSDDIDALGRMIAAEAGSESDVGKAGVLAVILNRYRLIKSGKARPESFGIRGKNKDNITVRDILFAGSQFSPIRDGRFSQMSSSSGRDALAAAIRGGGNDPEKFRRLLIDKGLSTQDADYVARSISFSNPKARSSRPFNTKEVIIGNHVFQQSSDIKLTGNIGKFDAEIREIEQMTALMNAHEKAKYLIVMSGRKGYRQVKPGESVPTDYLHHGSEDIRNGLIVRDYGITPQISGGSQMLEGEGAPLVVPLGMKAKAIREGPNALRFEDPQTGGVIARYHHVENIPGSINGKILTGGTFIGTQGGRPGAASAYGSSTAVHTHLEGSLEWHKAFIRTYAGGLDVTKTNLQQKLNTQLAPAKGDYDILIPLDHVPPHLLYSVPDKRGGNTFKNASQLGADGRERQYTDDIAAYVSQRLGKEGYRVKIVRPEEFGNYEDYDAFIEKHSKSGATVLPFHLDADPKRGGTGFLARIRKNDALDRKLAESLAPVLEKYTGIFKGGHRYGGIDTVLNATINRASAGPAALLELGSLETLEKLFGRNFVSKPQYRQFLDELTTSITSSVSKKTNNNKPVLQQKRRPSKSRSKNNSKIRQPRATRAKAKPNALQSTWSNLKSGFKKLTGLKRGGFIGNYSSVPSGYASYENYGGSVIVAIQPVMIQKEVAIDNTIPIPFPMPSSVNNVSNFRG